METKEKIKALIEAVKAIRDTIKELKEIPSGELYARLLNHITLEHYQYILNILVKAKQIEILPSHLIRFIG